MQYNKEAAKQYGYTDQEIDSFLAQNPNPTFNWEAARASGFTDDQIREYLKSKGYIQETAPTQQQTQTYQQAGEAYEQGQPTPQSVLPTTEEPVISYKPQEEVISYTPPTDDPVISYTPPKKVKQQAKQQAKKAKGKKTPDVVSPFSGEMAMTQAFNQYNPGMGYYGNTHKGEDFAAKPGEQGKTPIGGQVVSNYYDPAYGNTVVIKGLSPQEYLQLSGQDVANPSFQSEEDAVRLSHLAERAPFNPGEYVATGSAGLKFGSTGNSTGTHLDIESFPVGSPDDFEKKRSFLLRYPQLIKQVKF